MIFMEPATVISYNLLAVHHDVFFFIIIILCFVYWTLYKILKDFCWNIGIKQKSFLYNFLNKNYILKLEWGLLIMWSHYTKIINRALFNYLQWYSIEFGLKLLFKKSYFACWKEQDWDFFLVKLVPEWNTNCLSYTYINRDFSLEYYTDEGVFHIEDALITRYKWYNLYSIRTNGYLFHNKNMHYLYVQKFKHSTFLEFIFAFFPTLIIILIVVPSVYLLYSTNEETKPYFTIKIIGHQWYWSYEYKFVTFRNNDIDYFNRIMRRYQPIIYKKIIKNNEIATVYKVKHDSVMLNITDLKRGQKRLLEVDNPLILPIKLTLRL